MCNFFVFNLQVDDINAFLVSTSFHESSSLGSSNRASERKAFGKSFECKSILKIEDRHPFHSHHHVMTITFILISIFTANDLQTKLFKSILPEHKIKNFFSEGCGCVISSNSWMFLRLYNSRIVSCVSSVFYGSLRIKSN